jgi:pyruvate/2-oxoglutarate dehydrogenase complex dihydrolipoamide acyltransferase (E2) component
MADIRVPTLGESVTEATIGKWFKKPGDPVAVDEPLVELETDKVTIEVPAPAAGVLGDIAAKDGETVAVGALLGQIKEGEGAPGKVTPAPTGRPDQKTDTTAPINAAEEEPRLRPETAPKPPDDAADCAVGAQAGGGNRHRCVDRSGLREGRPCDQGRHDGGDRACRGRPDPRRSARRGRAGARAVAVGRCRPRRTREDDAVAPNHRAPAQGSAEHGRHAHDLQRGRHERGDAPAQPVQRSCSRRSTA